MWLWCSQFWVGTFALAAIWLKASHYVQTTLKMQRCCCSILRLSNFILIRFQSSRRQKSIKKARISWTSNSIRPSYTKLGTGPRQCSIQLQYYRMFCCKWFVIWYLFGELWGNATFARTLDEFHRLSSQPSPKVDFSGKQSHIFENLYPICHDISITISGHRGRGAPNTEFDFQRSYSGAASCRLGSCGFLRLCPRVGRCGHQKRDATVTWPARWGLRQRNGLWHLG